MSSSYEIAVDAFLNQLGQIRYGNLSRIWQAFMAYSMCIIVQAFQHRHYRVAPMNHPAGFRFKCFPQGSPHDYSYFLARKDQESFEIRLSINAQNRQWRSLRLNLDVVVIPENSIGPDDIVDAEHDVASFVECKNFRGFPELVATLEGMVYELQRGRLYSNSTSTFRIPACLFLTGTGQSILYMDGRYQSNGMSMRIFDSLQPGNPSIQAFILNWF